MDNMIENINEAELAEIMRTSCRLCLSQSQSRVNLLTKEKFGLSLMEMVNSLAGLQISEFDGSKSLNVCLNCAGKVINFHEFRQLCQDSDKKFHQMEMALHIKRRHNQSQTSNQLMQLDDDMEIIYVCKVCKATFEDHQLNLYKDHKKQHAMNGELLAQSTPVKTENDKKVKHHKKSPAAGPSTSYVANLYQCRQCTQTFRTYMSRLNHETLCHPKTDVANDKNETFPGTKKASKRLRGHRRSPVVKHKSESAKPTTSTKVYTCDTCNATFKNHKGKYWHVLKQHTFNVGKQTKTISCRYCNKTFEKHYSKYNHERVCTQKEEKEQNAQMSEDSEVVEQPLPVAPIVEITEDDGSLDETANVDGKFKCNRCTEEFQSLRARSLHEKNIHNLQVNECRVCGKIFASYATRYQHEKKCQLNNSMTSNNGNEIEEDDDIPESQAFPQSTSY